MRAGKTFPLNVLPSLATDLLRLCLHRPHCFWAGQYGTPSRPWQYTWPWLQGLGCRWGRGGSENQAQSRQYRSQVRCVRSDVDTRSPQRRHHDHCRPSPWIPYIAMVCVRRPRPITSQIDPKPRVVLPPPTSSPVQSCHASWTRFVRETKSTHAFSYRATG